MKSLPLALLTISLCCGFVSVSAAQTATQDITIVVSPINVIGVSDNALTLTIDDATPGSSPTAAIDATSTYSVTTNGTNMKITGALGVAYAAGISLAVELDAPTSGGVSAGQVTLTNVAQDLVTGLSDIAEGGMTITYEASATLAVAANNPAGQTQTVTFTVTAGG